MTTFDLGTVPLFSELPRDDLDRLSNGIVELNMEKGDALFDEGDEADRAYVIAEGELEILKESAGRNVRIAVSGPGDVVGEMALLTGEPRNAGAQALTPVRLIAIPRSCLEDVLATSVEANRALFQYSSPAGGSKNRGFGSRNGWHRSVCSLRASPTR